MASLDNAKFGLTFSSGLGAITATLALLQTGDHIVVGDDVYGGTNRLIRSELNDKFSLISINPTFSRYISKQHKIEAAFIDPTNEKEFLAAIKENTKVITFP